MAAVHDFFPALSELHLANNNIQTLSVSGPDFVSTKDIFPSLTTLHLENNAIADWAHLDNLCCLPV
jgi:hypothetical protein